eukprot:s40_g8.t1
MASIGSRAHGETSSVGGETFVTDTSFEVLDDGMSIGQLDAQDIEMAQEVAAKHTAEEEEAILGLAAASTSSLPTEFELLEGVTRVDLQHSLESLAEAMRNLTTKETKDIEVPADVDMSTLPGSAHGDQGLGSTKDHTAVLNIVKVDETVSKFDGYQLELPTFPTRLTPLLRNMTVGDLHALLEVFQTKVIPAATFPRLLECYGLTMQRLKHEEMWSVPHVKKQDATKLHHLSPGPRPKMVCKECKIPWPESRPDSGTCLMCQKSTSCELDSLQDFKLDANGTTWLLTITNNGICWKALGPDGEVSEDLTKSLKAQGAVDVGAMGHNVKTPEVKNPREDSFSDYVPVNQRLILRETVVDSKTDDPLLANVPPGDRPPVIEDLTDGQEAMFFHPSSLKALRLQQAMRESPPAKASAASAAPDRMEKAQPSLQIQRILESNHLLSTASLNWISESDKSEAMEQQLSFKSLIQNQQNPCPNSRLLEEVPECKLDMFQMVEGSSSADGEVDHPTTQPQLARKLPPGSMERKLAILESLNNTYICQVRCWGGRWVKVWQPMEIPSWAPSNDTASLQALERNTLGCDPRLSFAEFSMLTQEEIDDQIHHGQRPQASSVENLFWAKGDEPTWHWHRQVHSWNFASLCHRLSHGYTLSQIFSVWNRMPLQMMGSRRGQTSAEKAQTKLNNHIRVRKEVRTFLAEMGLTQMPESSSGWKDLYREIGKFLAAQTFLTHCPPEVMNLPIAAIRDSKSHLRERAVCDERISLPLSAFRSLDSIYSKLVSAVGSQHALIDVKVNWRCNNVLWWGVVLEEPEAVEFYRHLQYSDAEIQAFVDAAGIHAKNKYACRYCAGFWKSSTGSSRVVQLYGGKGNKKIGLQLILDEPPAALYEQWVRDRINFYLRVKPVDAIRDNALELDYPIRERLRFSCQNNLAMVSDLIWGVLLSNPDRDGLAKIQMLAANRLRLK